MSRKWVTILIAAAVSLAAAGLLSAQEEKKLEGRKVLIVIFPGKFREGGHFRTIEALTAQGAKITVASTRMEKSIGMIAPREAMPDVLLSQVKAADFDAVVFIGGKGTIEHYNNMAAQNLAREAAEKKKVIGAFCNAPCILANAGLLRGRRVTVFKKDSDIAIVKRSGARHTGSPVETDENLVTANGPPAAQGFADAVLKALTAHKILTGKKVVLIIAPDKFRDEELDEPKKILAGQGAKVVVASTTTKECKGMLGMKVKPDTTISKIKADEFDAIVFIGGIGAKKLFDNEKAHALAKKAVEKKKVLGAICLAPSILANAGVLKGKKATVFKSEKDNLTKKGAKYQEKDVVTDGRIVTANGPKAAKKFAQELVKKLRE